MVISRCMLGGDILSRGSMLMSTMMKTGRTINSCVRHDISRYNIRLMCMTSNDIMSSVNTTLSNTIDVQKEQQPTFRVIKSLSLRRLPSLYMQLAKARLAGLVVLTTMTGYAMAPSGGDLPTLVYTTAGTALCVCSANAFNQWIEMPYDAQMKRTSTRPLIFGRLSSLHAASFGVLTGTAGAIILQHCVNPITAVLGAANIFLYAGVYTPMKRFSIFNTHAGAVVGAIPPIMGWTACTGSIDPGALLLGGVLYAWQFPHFNALSWNLRADYSKAGYSMMCVTNPSRCRRSALIHALLMLPTSIVAPGLGMTTWYFAGSSVIANAFLVGASWQFCRNASEKTARRLFFGSIIHLPVLLSLFMLHKAPTSEATDIIVSLIKNLLEKQQQSSY